MLHYCHSHFRSSHSQCVSIVDGEKLNCTNMEWTCSDMTFVQSLMKIHQFYRML